MLNKHNDREFKTQFGGSRKGQFLDEKTGELEPIRLTEHQDKLRPNYVQKAISIKAMEIEDSLTDREYRLFGTLDYWLIANSTEIVLRDPDWEYLKQLLKVEDYTLESTFRGLVNKGALLKLKGTRHWMVNPRLRWAGTSDERQKAWDEWERLRLEAKFKPKRGRPKKLSKE